MDMCKPTVHHRKLEAMAGKWIGKEKIHPSPWDSAGGTAESESHGTMGMDGMWLVTDYHQKRNGQVGYRGHGVYGWDSQKGQYVMFWFDSMGDASMITPTPGKWEGNTLTFQNQSPMGHGRYVYTFDSDTQFRFRIEHSQDGQAWRVFMEGEFTKV